ALRQVRDLARDARDAEEVLLRLLVTLGARRGNLLGLAVADTDLAVAVTDDHQCGEAEPTAALDDLGHTVDRDDLLDVVGLVGIAPAASSATVAALSARAHAALPLLIVMVIRTPVRPRGRRRPGPRRDRRTCCRRGRRPRCRHRLPWRDRRAVRRPSWPWPSCRPRTNAGPPPSWRPRPACVPRGR